MPEYMSFIKKKVDFELAYLLNMDVVNLLLYFLHMYILRKHLIIDSLYCTRHIESTNVVIYLLREEFKRHILSVAEKIP